MSFDKMKKDKAKNADYMCAEIEHIIKTCGKRDPGSEDKKIACEYMADELKKYADDVKIEGFKVNPDSFYCSYRDWNTVGNRFLFLLADCVTNTYDHWRNYHVRAVCVVQKTY